MSRNGAAIPSVPKSTASHGRARTSAHVARAGSPCMRSTAHSATPATPVRMQTTSAGEKPSSAYLMSRYDEPQTNASAARRNVWRAVTSARRRSAPRVGAVRDGVQVAGGEALVAEGMQQRGVLAAQRARDLAADRDHLVAVVGVRDDVGVGAHVIEHGEVVGGEAADAARANVTVARADAVEAAEAAAQRRAELVGERRLDAPGRIGVDGVVVAHREGRGAALDAVAVALDVDAPRLVTEGASGVVDERHVGVDVQ